MDAETRKAKLLALTVAQRLNHTYSRTDIDIDLNLWRCLVPLFNGAVWFYSILILYVDNRSLCNLLSDLNILQNFYRLYPIQSVPLHIPTLPTIINLMRKEIEEKRCRKFLQNNRKYYLFNSKQSMFALNLFTQSDDEEKMAAKLFSGHQIPKTIQMIFAFFLIFWGESKKKLKLMFREQFFAKTFSFDKG